MPPASHDERKAKQNMSENGRFWEPAGDFVGRAKSGKKSKLEEVFFTSKLVE